MIKWGLGARMGCWSCLKPFGIKKGVCLGYRWAVVSVLTVILMIKWGFIGVHMEGLLVAVLTQI